MRVFRFVAAAVLALAACATESSEPAGTVTTTTTIVAPRRVALTRVADASTVCMVYDRVMGRPQTPVNVNGRTYFACCAMCEDRLGNEPAVRQAADPVTGERVDKATAVIAQDASGAVYYFATADHLAAYATR